VAVYRVPKLDDTNKVPAKYVPDPADIGAATAAQGAKADTAVQPGSLAPVATSGTYTDLTSKPTIPAAPADIGAQPAGDYATNTDLTSGLSSKVNSSTYTSGLATKQDAATLAATLVLNPDLLIVGTITRDANGAATSAPVVWPDGSPGTYTATTLSTDFPGAVDAYTVTYGSPVTKTYTQPAIVVS